MEKMFISKRTHLIWSLLFIFFPLFVVSSCEKQSDQFRQTQVSIFLINAEGKKTTQFKQDEIPIVVFEVVNAGKEVLSLYPRLYNREGIMLYDDENSEPIGNFYSDGQLTNDDPATRYGRETVTRIQLPWIWTDELRGEKIECTLDGEEISKELTHNSYSPASNSPLEKGNYRVKLYVPEVWEIRVAQEEITFQVN